MKLFVTFLCVASLRSAAGGYLKYERGFQLPHEFPQVSVHWLEQTLDHFAPMEHRTWSQRYMMLDTFWSRRENSPIFLLLGGEGEITAEFMQEAAGCMKYARYFGALCFQLEHRFYGESQPTGDLSTESLRYLSSEQALADVAYFIDVMNQQHRLTRANKWVVVGGSYAGSLAAWARLKYPTRIHAAVSSSAPLLAQIDFKGFHEVVEQVLEAWGPECAVNVHEAMLEIESNVGRYLKEFHAYGLQNVLDADNFISDLSYPINKAVQYNNQRQSLSVNDLCSIMTNYKYVNVVERLAAVLNSFYSYKPLDVNFHQMILSERNPKANRAWLYQTCTEFGWFQTSSTNQELYGPGIPLQYFIDICTGVFGPEFDYNRISNGINRSNSYYLQKDIVNHVSNVVFVQGTGDPWHVLGINESNNPKCPAIVIRGTSHCFDMFTAYDGYMLEAQNDIQNHIAEFLSDASV